jgi:hypothetical protein
LEFRDEELWDEMVDEEETGRARLELLAASERKKNG